MDATLGPVLATSIDIGQDFWNRPSDMAYDSEIRIRLRSSRSYGAVHLEMVGRR